MPKVSNKINWETDAVSFYKFICKDPEITFVYVGHTTNFATRKSNHKSACNNSNNLPVYQFIRANGGWENWTMIEIKSQKCLSHRDAERVEQELINQEHQVLNAHKAHSGINLPSNHPDYQTQYRIQNKEQIAEQRAQYYIQNKEQLAEQKAQYRIQNKEKVAQYEANRKRQRVEYQAKYRKDKKIEKAQHTIFKSQVLFEILTTTELIE